MEQSKKRIAGLAPAAVMALFSLTSLLNMKKSGLSTAGLATVTGAVLFLIMIQKNRRFGNPIGLSGKNIITDIKKSWLFIIMPSLINIISIAVSKIILPDYIDHVVGRSENIIALNTLFLMIIQFAVFAFIEEMAWRGYMQKQLKLYTSPFVSIVISSLFFAFGHIAQGTPSIVAYDVFFVFCNSIFYGLVFNKTKNTYASTISHFIANFTGALILLYIL